MFVLSQERMYPIVFPMNDLDLLYEQIEKAKTIGIFGHNLPDGDCYGSQIGLKEAILGKFSNKNVFALGTGMPQFYSFISKMDNEVDIKEPLDLGILVDVSCLKRVESKLINNCKGYIKFDHHCINKKGEEFPYPYYVDENRIACTEIIYDFLIKYGFPINKKCCSALYLGLVTDSGRFVYHGTSKHTFEVASSLIKKGADPVRILDICYHESKEMKAFKAYMKSKAKLSGDVTYLIINEQEYKSFDLPYEEASELVNAIAGVYPCHSYVYFIESPDGSYRVELRSNKLYPVIKVAQQMGGGGHQFAAGITLRKDNLNFKEVVLRMNKLQVYTK
ncbi:MAG TPA: hypothetical protein DCR94_01115 [Firmicutes bacterium]|nr:hypothetical protein [Bacillota bacterium]